MNTVDPASHAVSYNVTPGDLWITTYVILKPFLLFCRVLALMPLLGAVLSLAYSEEMLLPLLRFIFFLIEFIWPHFVPWLLILPVQSFRNDVHVVRWGKAGVAQYVSGYLTQYPWMSFTKFGSITEYANYFVLTSGRGSVVVPKRAFASSDDRRVFRDYVEAHVGKRWQAAIDQSFPQLADVDAAADNRSNDVNVVG